MTASEDAPLPPVVPNTWVIDNITEQSVSVEVDGASLMTVPLWLLPKGVQEGDVLRITREQRNDRSLITIVKDDEERRRRLAHSQGQVAITSKNDRPGNIVL